MWLDPLASATRIARCRWQGWDGLLLQVDIPIPETLISTWAEIKRTAKAKEVVIKPCRNYRRGHCAVSLRHQFEGVPIAVAAYEFIAIVHLALEHTAELGASHAHAIEALSFRCRKPRVVLMHRH